MTTNTVFFKRKILFFVFFLYFLLLFQEVRAQVVSIVLIKGIKMLAEDPEMVGRFLEKMGQMPNIKTKTMGGKLFWSNVFFHKGWRLQCNKIFGNCRILNPQNIRIAWGGKTALQNAFLSSMKRRSRRIKRKKKFLRRKRIKKRRKKRINSN